MAKTPITEREIHTYVCVSDPDRGAIAVIDGWNWMFEAESPFKAHRKADEWRKQAIRNDKLIPKLRKRELLGEEV